MCINSQNYIDPDKIEGLRHDEEDITRTENEKEIEDEDDTPLAIPAVPEDK